MLSDTIKEYINLLKMTKKPDREEFITTTKVSVVVMMIIGVIGFLIYILLSILPEALK